MGLCWKIILTRIQSSFEVPCCILKIGNQDRNVELQEKGCSFTLICIYRGYVFKIDLSHVHSHLYIFLLIVCHVTFAIISMNLKFDIIQVEMKVLLTCAYIKF